MKSLAAALSLAALGGLASLPALSQSLVFDNGNVDGRFASASRPEAAAAFEIESADDFVLAQHTLITSASFYGLLPTGMSLASIGAVQVEIYRVFPNDSAVGRTSGAPTFSTTQVPTRVNSPSDIAFDTRASAGATLSFSTALLSPSFTVANSLQPGGIHALPNITTGGSGAFAGQEVRFDVTFATPFDLAADHYFFVPQVADRPGTFFWLSASAHLRPGNAVLPDCRPGSATPLDPDWLPSAPTSSAARRPHLQPRLPLSGTTVAAVPEPETWALFAGGFALLALRGRRRALHAKRAI